MITMPNKKIVFITGTRADFGKLKSLMLLLDADLNYEVYIFVTGMHMLEKYGHTHYEVDRAGLKRIHKFYNQNNLDRMDTILAKTMLGFSDYIREILPDMIVVHGDRVEALAAAIVGGLANIRTAHIEGGEISGTIDEHIRHAITKFANIHFIANMDAKRRLLQLGEEEDSIHIIGSPDIDVMDSQSLPDINEVRGHYNINFESYSIVLFHPVTSEVDRLSLQVRILVDALIKSKKNYIVIYPNNDHGSHIIFDEYKRLENFENFRLIPSMRFEFFLVALQNARCIIGNSSAGIREAPHYGVPSINIGSRQFKRATCETITNVDFDEEELIKNINIATQLNKRVAFKMFGTGNSASKFHEILKQSLTWDSKLQKHFNDHVKPQS